MTKQMNNEHIRVAAYYLWQKAGCPNGMENDFWFQAQHQLYGSNLNNQNVHKSLSKSSATKLTAKKVSLKPALKSAVKKTISAKSAIVAKPFYGNKK
ncbi:MAG: DUF2934 domain-containing protein [Pseudomonadota bacterium]|nr:DUF2934 domain-containing protein [Pseudomonadota bacterium]